MDAGDLVDSIAAEWPKFKRGFPWRESRDPWLVLAAEVLLVQTDAKKVLSVWPSFVQRFPTPCRVLEVPREELEGLLRPLGLHRVRAERFVKMAEYLKANYGCSAPCGYEELRKVPGVGDYIAAAASIIACGRSAPALDVNVARVFSRALLGRDPPARYTEDRRLRALAGQVRWDRERLLAVLDFAAAICTARRPRCDSCPIRGACRYASRRGP